MVRNTIAAAVLLVSCASTSALAQCQTLQNSCPVIGVTANQGLTIGSLTIGLQDCAATQTLVRNAGDTEWECGIGGGSGDVVGPASSTDKAIPTFSGTGGKTLQNTTWRIDSSSLFIDGTDLGIVRRSASTLGVSCGSAGPTQNCDLKSGSIRLYSQGETTQAEPTISILPGSNRIGLHDSAVRFTDGPNSDNNLDSGVSRAAAGSLFIDGDTAGDRLGWLRWAGESYLASDQTNATATLATTTLSVIVRSGRKYSFKSILYLSDSVAAEGASIDFDGGSAAATNFRVHCTGFDAALALSAQSSALATDLSVSTFTGDGMIECHGSFEPSGSGTFIPRFAQNTHVTGTLTLYRGSHIVMHEQP